MTRDEAIAAFEREIARRRVAGLCTTIVGFEPRLLQNVDTGEFVNITFTCSDGTQFSVDIPGDPRELAGYVVH